MNELSVKGGKSFLESDFPEVEYFRCNGIACSEWQECEWTCQQENI